MLLKDRSPAISISSRRQATTASANPHSTEYRTDDGVQLKKPFPSCHSMDAVPYSSHQQSKYGNRQWGDIVSYNTGEPQYNTTPIHENQTYHVETSPVPIQSAYIVPGPPSHTAHQPSQPLYPLITMVPWSPSYPPSAVAAAPLATPVSATLNIDDDHANHEN